MSADKKSKKELLIERMQKIEVELKKIEARDNAAAKKLDMKRRFIVGEVIRFVDLIQVKPELKKICHFDARNPLVNPPGEWHFSHFLGRLLSSIQCNQS